ncbi:MAG: hypothetical protein SPK00_07810 [Corynebacterium glucuronolyticum]|nr:hypothetical protein [Mycobacteriaceae bacterium]MDY5834637.1 hypothetical protein [Corynebacterium glucuronolyticum]
MTNKKKLPVEFRICHTDSEGTIRSRTFTDTTITPSNGEPVFRKAEQQAADYMMLRHHDSDIEEFTVTITDIKEEP